MRVSELVSDSCGPRVFALLRSLQNWLDFLSKQKTFREGPP